jgi:hypothetical protein
VVTLEQDTTITAYYEISAEADADGDAGSSALLDRLARILNGDDCFDGQDQSKVGKAVSKIIKDIFGEDEVKTDKLERTLDNRIIEDCVPEDDGNERGQGNDDNRGPGRNGDDDEEEEEDD